ncbi:hypothetical protein [Streptomyces sp. NBC_00083]|uniref:hypothetical protein n=1 Tax=Streptomyces sp. NBC_00083 TaxID=2975647 RepID=UPI00224EFCAF|nr:hypothetical protein [Streptomyces sp. NBC_00083]MCX5382801.1 hypothetical protein [Streptomyces sp. NBC_00083]
MGEVRLTRTTRPVALLSALAVLLAALFICLAAGGGEGADPSRHHPDVLAGGPAQYGCPYDQDGCGLFPHAVPAVLTAPAPEPPAQAAAHGVRPVALRAEGAGVRPGARPRAPGLHVLQVLRT